MHINTGSYICTRGHSALNIATIALHGKGALAAHTAIGYDPEDIVQALMKDGVHKANWEEEKFHLTNKAVEFCVLEKDEPFTDKERIQMQVWLDDMVGWKYSIGELALQLLDGIWERITGHHTVFFRYLGDICQWKVICSKAANRPLVKLAYLPREAYYWSPQETYEYLLAHGWTVKFNTEGWYNG